MPYGKFKTVLEVSNKFDIEVKIEPFIDVLSIVVPEYPFNDITERLNEGIMSFVNETTICEDIIKPILNVVEKKYKALRIWSHVPFNVDPENDLIGEPDYLIAPRTKQGGMLTPPICVMEAKKENWDEGWAQTLAEMIAASKQGAALCYGIVTTGKAWEFGQLEEGSVFIRDPNQISATRELQFIFDTLNWIFDRANKSISR